MEQLQNRIELVANNRPTQLQQKKYANIMYRGCVQKNNYCIGKNAKTKLNQLQCDNKQSWNINTNQ